MYRYLASMHEKHTSCDASRYHADLVELTIVDYLSLGISPLVTQPNSLSMNRSYDSKARESHGELDNAYYVSYRMGHNLSIENTKIFLY